MIREIIRLLEKYEDEIMENTLGGSMDEYDERYAEVYKWEWKEHKGSIAYVLTSLIEYGIKIEAIGFAYIIISQWDGVMCFDEGDLNIEGLKKVCEKIIKELNV